MREDDSNWFSRWEEELPSPEELMPLSQTLITPDLALAFDIRNPNSSAVANGVAGGSPTRTPAQAPAPSPLQPPAVSMGGVAAAQPNSSDFGDSADLGSGGGGGGGAGEEPARTLKRPRLVWTPQLHKRFVDAVAHLGIKNAVPKTIMQLMSVDGLTRENVASHLQKYRLYLKRMQSLSGGGGAGAGGAGAGGLGAGADPATDHLFASSPVPAHFLHPAAAAAGGRSNSEHYLPFVPVAALQHHQHHHHQHHQHMAAAAAAAAAVAAAGNPQIQGQYHHRQVGHFGSPPAGNGGGQFDHAFLGRQGQGIHRIGAPVHNGVPGYVEDLDSGNAGAAGGRRVLTLFPTGED